MAPLRLSEKFSKRETTFPSQANVAALVSSSFQRTLDISKCGVFGVRLLFDQPPSLISKSNRGTPNFCLFRIFQPGRERRPSREVEDKEVQRDLPRIVRR